MKINPKQAAKMSETKKYFMSEYALNKVRDIKVGDTIYFMFLKPEENLYCNIGHRMNNLGDKVFKNAKYTKIRCKSQYDENGNVIEDGKAICCLTAESEKQRVPEREDSKKRALGFASMSFHVPIVLLGSNITDSKKRKYPVSEVKISNGYEFSILEFTKSAWSGSVVEALIDVLKNKSVIDFYAEADEATDAFNEYLSRVIVKLTIKPAAEGSTATHSKSFEFILFDDESVAKNTGEQELIKNWEKSPKMAGFRNDVADYLTLFELHEPEFLVDWEEKELVKYLEQVIQKEEDKKAFDTADKEHVVEEDIPTLVKPKKQETAEQNVPEIKQISEVDTDIELDVSDYEYNEDEEEYPED